MAHISWIPETRSWRTLRVHGHRKAWLAGVCVGVLSLLGIAGYFINAHWPYRYRVAKPLLEDVLGSQIQIARYKRTYLPNPGFVATGVTLRRKSAPDQPPLGTAQQLVVQGSWIDLVMLRQKVQFVDIEGLHIVVPAPGSRANHEDFPPGSTADFAGPNTLIEKLKIHNSLLEVMRPGGGRLSYPIRELAMRSFGKGRPDEFVVDMDNALPHGRIQSTGTFGPINVNTLAHTPVAGTFKFTSVALHDVGEIGGTLDSEGKYSGSLGAIEVSARTKTPDFSVAGGKPTPVNGEVSASVNGLTGEVVFHQLRAETGKTVVTAVGAVQGSPKETNLDVEITNGRAQDVMRPFMERDVPVTGAVWLKCHAFLAHSGAGQGFLQRLEVTGAFEIPKEKLTDEKKEKDLTDFSKRAQGQDTSRQESEAASDERDTFSSLRGPASIRDGVATSHGLKFEVAGASAVFDGTFNFHTEAVHMIGTMAMHSDFSHITTGFKSWLLKPLNPFMKKKAAGAVVPIAVTGTPGKYQVSLDFGRKK